MKKKSQKFTSFVSRTQYVNYQDTSHIVSEFNHSVRLYKRFVVALNGGDDELAAKKLREAGIYTGILMMPLLPFINDTKEKQEPSCFKCVSGH